MRPEVLAHIMTSLDGRITGFEADIGLYYGTAAEIGYDAALVGSNTVLAIPDEIPPEIPSDKVKKAENVEVPYFVLVDSQGRVRSHHLFRRQEYIRDVLVLVSPSTPKEYIEYLRDRDYDNIVTGSDKVDLKEALEILNERYGIRRVRTDTGDILISELVRQGLVDELSIIALPVLVGDPHPTLFESLKLDRPLKLDLIEQRIHPGGAVHLRYRIMA